MPIKKGFLSIKWFALFFAIFFGIVAWANYKFFSNQLKIEKENQASVWFEQINREIIKDGQWDIAQFDQSEYQIPRYTILSKDGLIIDFQEFISGLFKKATSSEIGLYKKPVQKSEFGTDVLVFATTTENKDGTIFFQIDEPNQASAKDILDSAHILASSSLNAALQFPIDGTPLLLSYAIIDNNDNLKFATGANPIRIEDNISNIQDGCEYKNLGSSPPNYISEEVGNLYLVCYRWLPNKLGLVVIPQNVSAQQQAIQKQLLVDLLISVISLGVFLLYAFYGWNNLRKRVGEAGTLSNRIGGEEKKITVLFSDIKDFTTLSENSPPSEVVNILNNYFTAMTAEVHKNGGHLDKFIGDGVMAFWEGEGEEEMAVKAALAMQKELKTVNEKLALKIPLEIRIGIYTGEAIVGNIGSRERISYTAIGDTVNVASRLEGLNKQYGTSLMIGESTYEKLTGKYNIKHLGESQVKGREKPIKIYSISQ